MQALAKSMNLAISPSSDELKNQIAGVSYDDLNKSQQKQLRSLAQNVQGVDLNQSGPDLLNDIKRRMTDQTTDVLKSLRTSHIREGGDGKNFDNVLQVAQGLPYHWLGR